MRMMLQKSYGQKKLLFAATLILSGCLIVTNKPLAVAAVSVLALLTLTIHFDVFDSTNDPQLLNRLDLGLQVALVAGACLKFFLLVHHII